MSDLFDPSPESATEARIDAEIRGRLRADLTEVELCTLEIEAKQREREQLREKARTQRALVLDQLRDSGVLPTTKSRWIRVLEDDDLTSDGLAQLQADIANYRRLYTSPLAVRIPSQIERDLSFLQLFEVEVGKLLASARAWDRTFG